MIGISKMSDAELKAAAKAAGIPLIALKRARDWDTSAPLLIERARMLHRILEKSIAHDGR